MPLLYKLHQDNRTTSPHKGEWYARAVMNGTVGTDQLAEIMQRNCTLKKSDIKAVLTELVETMQDQLQNSMRVKLDGFGAFKLGMKTSAAATPVDFNVSKNVKSLHVNFQPEVHIDSDRNRIKAFLQGTTIQETAKNDVE